MSEQPQEKHAKKSKLELFELGFEYNRTLKDERRIVKQRTDKAAH